MPGSVELLTLRGYIGTVSESADIYQLSATETSLLFQERKNNAWRTVWEIPGNKHQ